MNHPKLVAAALLALATCVFAEDPPKIADTDAQAKADALGVAMKDGTPDEKTVAISNCGLAPHSITANALAPLLSNAADDIRTNAVAALALMKGIPEACKALEAGISANEEKAPILTAIFNALATLGQPTTIPVLKEWVDKKLKKKETATLPTVDSAIECLAGLKHKKTVEVLIALLKGAEDRAPKPAKGAPVCAADSRLIAALSRLTSQGMQTAALWSEWWKKNEVKYNDDLSLKKK